VKKVPVFTDWVYEWDCPPDILEIAVNHASSLYHHTGVTNHTTYPEEFFTDVFDPVREWIDGCLAEIHKDLNLECESLITSVAWSTLTNKGQWHHTHRHGFSFASGVLYLNESSAETWFSRESIWSPKYNLVNLHDPERSTLFYKRKTDPGTMLVFPSRLQHSVTEHDREEPRRSISFNSFPSGQIGSYSDKHSRRLANITVHQKK
jgi:uncharacterized protein (TIGR02466 family)